MQKITKFSLVVLFVMVSGLTLAQNNTNSPYTRFGYGEITDNGSGKSKAMGGTSIGIRSNTCINTANPASYTSIDSLTFMFEFGGIGQMSRFTNSQGSIHTYNANIEYITMQFPIKKWLAGSAGLLPYSFVGYNFSSQDSIPTSTNNGIEQVKYTLRSLGTGSLNQAYIGLSAKIGKHFAIGLNTSYIFGSIQNTDSLTFVKSDITSGSAPTTRNATLSVRDINFRYGLQYFTNLSKNTKLTVGLIFENKSSLNGDYSLGISGVDTISSKNKASFEKPLTIGGGLSFDFKDKLTIGGDFLYQNWADAKFFGVKDSLSNRTKFSIGGEYLPNINSKKYINKMTYRFGAFLKNDYLNINKSTSDYGLTFGLGLPSKGTKSLFNLGFEYGKIGSVSNNLIKEDYYKISFNVTFNETWFFKRRFE